MRTSSLAKNEVRGYAISTAISRTSIGSFRGAGQRDWAWAAEMLPASTNPAKTKALSTLRVVMAYVVCFRCTRTGNRLPVHPFKDVQTVALLQISRTCVCEGNVKSCVL